MDGDDDSVEPGRQRVGERESLARHAPFGLLAVVVLGLTAGGLAELFNAPNTAGDAWRATGIIGAVYALWTVVDGIRRRRLGVDIIALLAVVGAVATGEELAAAVIATMLATGGSLENWSASRARRALVALTERAPRVAHRYTEGLLETVDLREVQPGDVLMVATGELVPVDGRLSVPAVLDESMLTGESLPVARAVADAVRSGAVNAGGPFDMRATATPAESTYSGIVRLVAAAQSSRPAFVRLADRYALLFLVVTGAVTSAALIVAGPTRAVAVLVVATPCPLILAAPVAFVAGLSNAARRGLVVKGGDVLERLARCTTLLFDKTGTLTEGRPRLVEIATAPSVGVTDALCAAASLDQFSPHLLAAAIVRGALEAGCSLDRPENVNELPGEGIRGDVGGRRVAVGSSRWAGFDPPPRWAKGAQRRARLDDALTVFVSVNALPIAVLVFEDPIRADAARTVRALRQAGIDRLVMATGDREEVAESIASALALDAVEAELSPADKLDLVKAEQARAPTMMVGDGVNDAPALAAADVGVAMGARGATASSQAADVVMGVDRLDRLAEGRGIAVRTRRIAMQSVVAGMALSLAAMGFAAMGGLPAVWGALLQEGIDAAVILNALRALHQKRSTSLDTAGLDLARRFRGEHRTVEGVARRALAVAGRLGTVDVGESLAELRDLHRQLVEVVLPHEASEDRELYPSLDRAIGGINPTAPMSREHAEISHQVRRLGRLLDDIRPETWDEDTMAETRYLLHGLATVLRLHTAQEEESYLSLGADDTIPSGRSER